MTIVKKYEDLITSKEQTRAGFITFALEKNRKSSPIIEDAKSFKVLASKANTPSELQNIDEIRAAMITAAGLSDKSLKYFTEADKDKAIQELITNFLEPVGVNFIDELIYRYLLIKGDSLGGSMRNLVGTIAEQKLIRSILSCLSVKGDRSHYLSVKTKAWIAVPKDDYSFIEDVKALSWMGKTEERVLGFNLKVPIVGKNIDICLFNVDKASYIKDNIVNTPSKILMLGELKGGIDPAGADEHWKTANSALGRIRSSFKMSEVPILTSFAAAAIEKSMASEIYAQLKSKELDFAANITIDTQLVEYCNWILGL
ncbi:MAG: AvaI/BsoBI family type II restriction endonuclease [Rikenellaceae bacterium]